MSEAVGTDLVGRLAALDEKQWRDAAAELAEEIHEVDRAATHIWLAFWPPKLTRLLRTSEDPLQTAQELLLYGEYQLEKVLDRSLDFLYGGRWWTAVRQEAAGYAAGADLDPEDIAGHARTLSRVVSEATGAPASQLLGVCLVALAALARIGPEAFARSARPGPHPFADQTPEQICARREKERRRGLFGFLRTVDRRHDVRWDESDPSRTFEAVHGQDITMAGANAAGSYTEIDARRVEGPVPIQCRNGACGFCWVGVLFGAERLSEMTSFERKRMGVFGYLDTEEEATTHPTVRLACQARVLGDVTIVVPPWNGVLNGRS